MKTHSMHWIPASPAGIKRFRWEPMYEMENWSSNPRTVNTAGGSIRVFRWTERCISRIKMR